MPTRSSLPRKSKQNAYTKTRKFEDKDDDDENKSENDSDVINNDNDLKSNNSNVTNDHSLNNDNSSYHHPIYQNSNNQDINNNNSNNNNNRQMNYSKYPPYHYQMHNYPSFHPYYHMNDDHLPSYDHSLQQDITNTKKVDESSSKKKDTNGLSVSIPDYNKLMSKSMGSPTSLNLLHSPTIQPHPNVFGGPHLSPTSVPNFMMFPDFYSSFLSAYSQNPMSDDHLYKYPTKGNSKS